MSCHPDMYKDLQQKLFMHYHDIWLNTLLDFDIHVIRIYMNASILYIYNNDLQNKNRFLFYWCVIL